MHSLRYNASQNTSQSMTYILGSRCSDGVVIVSDTKFTIDNGAIAPLYDVDKVTGEFPGFITAFSGERHKFERFRGEIREFRSTHPCQISIDRMLRVAVNDTIYPSSHQANLQRNAIKIKN